VKGLKNGELKFR